MKKLLRHLRASSLLLLAITIFGCGGGGGGGGGGSSDSPAVSGNDTAPRGLSSSPYQVQLLGTLGEDNYAVAINDSGQVVGNYLADDGTQHLFRWSDGNLTHLVGSAQATDINDAGEVSGWLFTDKGTEAFIYTDQVYLFDLPEGSSRAYALDSAGRVAGRFSGETEQAFLDEDGAPIMLAPELDAYAIGINDPGQILIKELRPSGFHTLLMQPDGSMVDLGSFGGGCTQASDINESGQVAGWSQTSAGKYQAFLWENGRMISLAEPEWSYSSAVAIDDAGRILIKATVGTEDEVFLWEDGRLTNLENFEREYVEVADMNNEGQIVGWTVAGGGKFQAFLATPVR